MYHCKIERWLNIEVLFYFLKFMDPHLTRNIWFCWLFNYPNWWIWTHPGFILLFHSNLFILMDKLHSTQIVHLKVKIVGQKPKRENWFIMWKPSMLFNDTLLKHFFSDGSWNFKVKMQVRWSNSTIFLVIGKGLNLKLLAVKIVSCTLLRFWLPFSLYSSQPDENQEGIEINCLKLLSSVKFLYKEITSYLVCLRYLVSANYRLSSNIHH